MMMPLTEIETQKIGPFWEQENEVCGGGGKQSLFACKETIGWVEAKVEFQNYPMKSTDESYGISFFKELSSCGGRMTQDKKIFVMRKCSQLVHKSCWYFPDSTLNAHNLDIYMQNSRGASSHAEKGVI